MAQPVTAAYDQGEVALITDTFTDTTDRTTTPLDPVTGYHLVDPTTVKFVAKAEDGTYVRYTYGVDSQLTRLSQGVYRASLPLTVGGTWEGRFYSTGSGQASSHFLLLVASDTLI